MHGTGALFSTAYGNVGSSIYYALGVVAAFALGLTPIAFLVAGLIFMLTAATYSEATVMYPEAGGSSSFARHAFNELVSFLAAWGQMLNYVITVAISAFFVPDYFSVLWEPLGDSPTDIFFSIALIAGLVGINILGGQESARLNIVLAIGDLLTQVFLVGLGVFLVLNPDTLAGNVEFGVAPTWGDFALGVALGMIAYTGIETLSNMSEEARDAPRTIPRAVGLVVAAVLVLYLLIPLVALSAMPVTESGGEFTTELGTTYAENPMLGIVDNMGLSAAFTDVLRIYVGILAGVILIIATNAGLIGLSRLTFSMGTYRQLPQSLRAIHPKFRTPYLALIVFGAVSVAALIPGETELLATMYSFGAMLSFTIAHLALVRLRQRYPDREREWRAPFSIRMRGWDLPLTAVFGCMGTGAAWIVVMALNTRTLILGSIWMLVGITTYVVYRRVQGLPLTETHKVILPEALGVEEIEYESVLVAFEDDAPFSEDTVATAVKLAAKRRRGVHVVSMLTVPQSLPLDAPVPERESEAQSKVEQAKLIGGLRVSGHVHRVRPNQAGHSIAQEAAEMQASAVVVGLRYRDGRPLYGKTLQAILAERPCRVIVVGEPTLARAEAERAEGMGVPG
ncbi:MAG: UspA domain protein [Solirubrobacterales bacterium]|nr:UspA domain protein [Solirubrobacterales bacterium]